MLKLSPGYVVSRFQYAAMPRQVVNLDLRLLSSLLTLIFFVTATTAETSEVDFGNHVRPILIRHCDRCHGTKNQKADLQLNRRGSVLNRGESAERIIVPGNADQSQLIQRLTNSDAGDIMPLDDEPLTDDEINLLTRWINEGAVWPDRFAEAQHWAWTPTERPPLPDPGSSFSPIDQFVYRRLSQESMAPTVPLDRPRLMRRVSLALTGIPSTPIEVDSFINDDTAHAYEKVVDRLLQSPQYGERWAVPWMDLARYADSNGFQADQLRDNWAWRDWVIRAFNADMPFDVFVTDQLAGDLRPNATVNQRIATGFHRMTTCNVEAGVDPEANRVNQIVDRVSTTATAFLGITLECAQCHDHKYDPFTQEDYFRFFAFFNNSPLEVRNTSGVTWDFYGPTMDLPLDEEALRRQRDLSQKIDGFRRQRERIIDQSFSQCEAWLAKVRDYSPADAWTVALPESFATTGTEEFTVQEDGSVLITGEVTDEVRHTVLVSLPDEAVTAIRLETLTDKSIPGKGPGRGNNTSPDFELRGIECEIVRDGQSQAVTIESAQADFSARGGHISGAIDDDNLTVWSIGPQYGQSHWARFIFSGSINRTSPHDRLRVTLIYSRQSIGRPRISLTAADPATADINATLVAAAQNPTASEEQREQLQREFEVRHPVLSELNGKILNLRFLADLIESDTTLVMVEMEEPRDTFIFTRGDHEQPGESVSAGTPRSLPAATNISKTGDRMELARWLTSDSNPLFARVTVNRWWTDLFGTGLVTTPEDFGTQADSPSHPELLDWLADEFRSSGWSMKHIHKLIVMSNSWRQVPTGSSRSRTQDPDNRLLARGPRFRLLAETIRDNALAISGLLSGKMYGEPVMPYQPKGVWRSVGRNQPEWAPAVNEDRFRRGVYVICKRAAPYPSFITFDAPDRGSCTVQRSRSNTPLQALTLLNDKAYVEMALSFADRILSESTDATDTGRIHLAMRLAVTRMPTDQEIAILQQLLDEERNRLVADPKQIDARVNMRAPGTRFRSDDPVEIAAWFAVTNAILNLDETMTQ